MASLVFSKTKNGHKTTIVHTGEYLRGSRLINGTIVTITTKMCETASEFARRANNLVDLSNEDFTLMQDFDELLALDLE